MYKRHVAMYAPEVHTSYTRNYFKYIYSCLCANHALKLMMILDFILVHYVWNHVPVSY